MSRKRADRTEQVAFDLGAPAAERRDAQAELQKAYLPLANELLPAEPVRQLIEHIHAGLEEEQFRKAHGAKIIPFPGSKDGRQRGRGMKSVMIDNLSISIMGDYYERPSAVGFDSMRQMVEQTPILNAIVLTRMRQVSRFCEPLEADDGPGFEIRHIDRHHQLSKEERDTCALLARFVNNCGWEFSPRRRRGLHRDNFRQFMQKVVRDSLSMDSAPIETEFKRDRRRGVDGFYAVDGSTIRLCTDKGHEGDDEVFALQVIQGRVMTAYTRDDLIYEPRNPRTEVNMAGYGLAETELLVRIVTGFLNALTLNIKGFTDNSLPRGILTLIGDYGQTDLDAFKRYWRALLAGVNHSWAMPVMTASNPESAAKWQNLGVEFNEMYFARWMTFLTSIACAIYGMSPDEINFESFAVGRSALSGDATAERIANSQDKGLRPLMSYFEALISDFVLSEFGDKFVFRWSGMEDEDEQVRQERRKLTMTLDEMRAEDGRIAIGGVLGGAPINPNLVGVYMQSLPQDQGDYGQGTDTGDSGGPGDEGEEDDRVRGAAGQGGDGDSGTDSRSRAARPDNKDAENLRKSVPPAYRPGWY
jgi:hypothetical protein